MKSVDNTSPMTADREDVVTNGAGQTKNATGTPQARARHHSAEGQKCRNRPAGRAAHPPPSGKVRAGKTLGVVHRNCLTAFNTEIAEPQRAQSKFNDSPNGCSAFASPRTLRLGVLCVERGSNLRFLNQTQSRQRRNPPRFSTSSRISSMA